MATTTTAREILDAYIAVRGGDSSSVVSEAVASFKVAVEQLCDSRRAEQLAVAPAESVARTFLEQFADVRGGTSDSAAMAEALGALRAVLAALLVGTPHDPPGGRPVLVDGDVFLARYLTAGGAATGVQYRLATLRATCDGEACDWTLIHSIGLEHDDTEAVRDEKIRALLPYFQDRLRTHAAQCYARPGLTHDTGSPDSDPSTALHWAAYALRLATERERQGRWLTSDEQVVFTRFQSAARAHGFTEDQVREYSKALRIPAVKS
ncbi:hypothetical protein [Streptomyces sp. NPDC088794]|uniref:hypothetical protein n=1 Tax=Streptomyces sp. NPDC088794 TaxID=3365902 RepID=UPI00381748CD